MKSCVSTSNVMELPFLRELRRLQIVGCICCTSWGKDDAERPEPKHRVESTHARHAEAEAAKASMAACEGFGS